MTENTPENESDGRADRRRDDVPPAFAVPASAMRRFGAVFLDPATAERIGDEPAPRPVAYLPRQLFVPGLTGPQLERPLAILQELGREMEFTAEIREDDVAAVAGWVSPNPGGVGPMTRAMLLSNIVEIAEQVAR